MGPDAAPPFPERLLRYAVAFEAIALAVVSALALPYAALARVPYREAFGSVAFAAFLLILLYAVLSGPGMFLARPRLAPVRVAETRWRRWLAAPFADADREFYELVLYVGLGFLLLAIATSILALSRWLVG